jgi:small-conductance mechanosensitive channel
MVAGVILIYTRAFHMGDRVKIGDAMGDIVEKTLLVTRIRTPKNVVITIPNSTVLNSQIVNYSSLAKAPGNNLILHTTVTLGYDLPWRKVHETLISAARASQHILVEPAPFVLQTSLDDSYVSYELNAYTDKPIMMGVIYSELHQNIQDKCNEVGIEILSPHYRAVRDGNQNTIPENYLPTNYVAPGFKISPLGNFFHPSDSKTKANEQELAEGQDY